MNLFRMSDLIQAHREAGKLYHEFLKVDALSVGLYMLPAGSLDPQQPHTEDEVYYVVSGRAEVMIGEEVRSVEMGSIIYVPAKVEHRFQSIVEDLTLLVFFAPAEYSQS
jgi:mannose-6-phosphate isomerase-like protein (cupin superfamily)